MMKKESLYLMSKSKKKYRSDIDGLRAIAVLLVVGYHAFPMWIKGGFIGVDVFFVISGFLISTIIFENLKNNDFSFRLFYGNRIKRIFPSLIVVLLSSLVFGWFLLFPDEYKQLGHHITGGVQFISNYILWNESGYFDNAADTKPLLHLWSLGIEEQFYIIWPLFLWASWKKKINWFACCVVLMISSFTLNVTNIRSDTIATFYSPLTRFWELLIGSSLAYLIQSQQAMEQKINTLLGPISSVSKFRHITLYNLQSLLGAGFLVTGAVLITKEKLFPGMWALLPTIGTFLIISSGSRAWFNCQILSHPIFVWFGLISFPLYLWHWPVLSLIRIIEGKTPSIVVQSIAVLVSIVLAWLTYILVEKPVRFGRFNRISILFLVPIMFFIGSFGFSVNHNNGFQNRMIAKNALDFTYDTSQLGYLPCQDQTFLNENPLNYCFISTKGKVDAVIIGDSHADDKFHGIVKNDTSHHWMLIGHNSCPPVYGIDVEADQKGCQAKFEKIVDWLVTKPEIKMVVLSYFGNYFLTTNYAADHVKANNGPSSVKLASIEENKSRADVFEYGLNNIIQKLDQAKKQVILFIDVPELPFFPKDCYRNPYLNCTLSRKEVDARQSELRVMIQKLKAHQQKLFVFDPVTLFCNDNGCMFKNNETILYRDSHHLTLKGSDLYGQYFVQWQQKEKLNLS